MILLWALVGGVVGLLLGDEHLLGFATGVSVAVLLRKMLDLQRRLKMAEQSLDELRTWKTQQETAPPPFITETSITDSPAVEAEMAGAVAEEIGPPPLHQTTPPPSPAVEAISQELPPPLPKRVSPTQELPPPLVAKSPPPHPRVAEPNVFDNVLATIKGYFTEGNVPVKIGVLVLFAGVAAALRFAAAEGYFTVPIGLRLSLIAAAALAGLGLGWRERRRRKVFGLSLQGGSIGVLLLTVFATYRLYGLLPSGVAFAFVVVLVAGAALLAVLQRSMGLAVLGFLGGYLAPVLLSTGSGNHVALFSYYAVLNAAVFAISWRQHWRLLNLIGFFFTFGIGAAWFSRSYAKEMFWTVEPFLILFFLFYLVIGLLYATRQTEERRRPWLDGTLVFGTPLVAFPMQAMLLRDEPMALAFSAVAVAGIYLGLLYWLRQHRGERLLTEAYGALALGFATLAVPLAFSAGTTTSLWALEGAAVAWMGLRQKRTFPWLVGLGLQLLACIAYLVSEFDRVGNHDWLVLNSTWLGAALLGFAGMALAWVHDRYKPKFALPALLMLWGLFWWTLAGLTQLDAANRHFPSVDAAWLFAVGYLALSLLLAGGLRRGLAWPRLGWGMALWSFLTLLCVFWAEIDLRQVLALEVLPAWLGYLVAWCIVLWLNRAVSGRSVHLTHGLGLWTVTLAVTMHFDGVLKVASGWSFLAVLAPLWLLTLGLWRRPRWLAWPRAEAFETSYRVLWFGLALPLLALFWLFGLFADGLADPLPYVPLLNPLEIGLAAIALLLWLYSRDRLPSLGAATPLWVAVAFAFVSMATLRTAHHFHAERWSPGILDSAFVQTSLTVVWSLIGVIAWVAGSRRGLRPLWLAGAGLMGVVLLKLILIDRQYMGNIPGIVSFLAVGLLLVAVGYFAPSPNQTEEST